MSLSATFSTPWFTGSAQAVDTRWAVYLGGHPYEIDMARLEEFGWQTVPAIRQQADSADRPNEGTLNPEAPWRRAVDSWHLGAGQEWLDKPDSSPFRFHTSKGIDPWTRYGLSLLPDTTLSEASADTNLHLAVSGGRLYLSEGQTIRVTGVGNETWGDASGEPAAAVTALATDGATVYAGFGASGIYTATGTAFGSVYTGTVDLVRYVKGRLLCANGPALHNPVAPGAIPAAFYTHVTPSWVWTDACPGPGHIYLAGYAGDKSYIYKTAVEEDGTDLQVPIVAAELPDGEIARSITGYLWYVVIGTSRGIRFAVPDGDGFLNIGSLIETGSPVLCGEGQDRFVWYGLTDYDATSTGLGRIDLGNFTADLTPAYASDLMATAQGDVTAVATYRDKRWFAVAGDGLFVQSASTVASGEITTGRITFGIPDAKTAINAEVIHDPLPSLAEVTLALATDGAAAEVVGTSELDGSSVSTEDTFAMSERGSFYEVTMTLAGAITVRRLTLIAEPNPERTWLLQVPLLLHHSTKVGVVSQPVDVLEERRYLRGLVESGEIVNYQESGFLIPVKVADATWSPHERTDRGWSGTMTVRLKEIT